MEFFLYTFSTYTDHFQPYFFNFFLGKKTNDSFKQKKSQVALAMASPSHCCVSSLVTSLTAWECALGQHSQLWSRLPSPMVGKKSCGSLVWCRTGKFTFIFFFGGTYCTKKYKISGNFPGHLLLFLVEIWVSCCQMVWCILIVGRCFTLKPTRGGALNRDFFLTARDVMMERWDPSNSGVDILAENWWLEDEYFPFKHGQTFSGHSTFVRLLGSVFIRTSGLVIYQTPGVFFVASPQVRRDASRVFFPDSCRTASPNGCKHVRPEISEGSAACYEATILGVFAPPQSFEPMRLTEKSWALRNKKNWHHFLGFHAKKPRL